MNKCFFIGNLTKDPESSTTTSGISLCRFSIAVNRSYVVAGSERETDFINIVAWRGLADNCAKYLSKGKKVAVCGELQTRSYEAKDGTKRYVFEISAESVEFLSPAGAAPQQDGGYVQAPQANKRVSELKPIETGEEDFPF